MTPIVWYAAVRTSKQILWVAAPAYWMLVRVRCFTTDTGRAAPWVIPERRLRYALRATDRSVEWLWFYQPGIEVAQ
ncbi:hypothetical protein MLPF_1558 [Mycobacterium lepromatosis]|nr:hypothetical protein MLPF_1558 [Mycobacterium lepromatosis]